jgi:antitoxin YefM
MSSITDIALREDLARYLDEAAEGRVPIVVTRQPGKGAVLLMSVTEFEGWQETAHVLSHPRNAEVLLRSIKDADEGRTEEHALIPVAVAEE